LSYGRLKTRIENTRNQTRFLANSIKGKIFGVAFWFDAPRFRLVYPETVTVLFSKRDGVFF